MSKIKLTGHASGSGVLTIAAPNTDSDRTITLPDVTGTLLDSGSDLPAANLTGTVADARISALTASKLTGALPAISGANLTNIPATDISGKLNLSGGTMTGQLNLNSHLDMGDNHYIALGASDDFQIYHDGSNSYIADTGTGNLLIKGSNNLKLQSATGEDMVVATTNDAVNLYYDNVKKFETTNEGAKVTGHLRLNNSQQIQFGGSATHIDGDSGYMAFDTSSAEAMRLDSAGRLLIGTTSNSDVNDSGLSVRADSYGLYVAKFAHRKANGDGAGVLIDIENYTGSPGQTMIRFDTSAGQVGSIKSNQSSTSYNTSSDYRLKENVDYTWDATTRLKQLKPARFNFIVDDTNTLVDGFIAHEVSSVVPEAISGEKDETKDLTNVVIKANGVVKESNVTEAEWTQGKTDGEYPTDSTWAATHTENINQSIDQSKLVPLLVKTIQELEARITAGGL